MTDFLSSEGRREIKALAEKAGADIVGFEINPVHQSEKPPGLATELFNVWVERRNRDGFTDESRFASGMLREDAEYVVAANPATVLSLLAALEEAERRIEAAHEAFLNFVADAKKFEQDIDGEYDDGRAVVTIRYDIVTEHHGLWELIGALGFKHRRDETPFDAVCREIEEEPVAALTKSETPSDV